MTVIPLYDNGVLLPADDYVPTLEHYAPKKVTSTSAVVIFPGGGYAIRADYEGKDYAEFFNENGIHAFVCQYRVRPASFPRPLLDARHAVRFVRANAEKYGIDPNKILVMGSSAGGHLASLVSTYRGTLEGEEQDSLFDIDPTPNGTILCYSVTDMVGKYTHVGSRQNLIGDTQTPFESVSTCDIVDDKTPPAFLWHTSADGGVPVANSYKYALALREHDIPAEVHVFPFGRHGLGLSPEDAHVAQWAPLLINWMTMMGF